MFTEIRVGRQEGRLQTVNLRAVEYLAGGTTDDEGNVTQPLEFHMMSGQVISTPFLSYEKGIALFKTAGLWAGADDIKPLGKSEPTS